MSITRVGERYSKFFCTPRFSSQSFRTPPTDSSEVMIIAVRIGSSIFWIEVGGGNFVGLSTCSTSPAVVVMRNSHARRGGDQVDVEFALEALLHDFHVQQAQKSAAEAESQRHGSFRLVEKCGVVQLQFAERVAQIFVIGRVHGIQAREDHGLDGLESGERRRGLVGRDHRVAHARIGHALDVGDDEAHVARGKLVEHDGLGREHAEIFHFVDFVR